MTGSKEKKEKVIEEQSREPFPKVVTME